MVFFEDLLQISIADLKQLGYFVPGTTKSGVIRWVDLSAKVRVTVDNSKHVMSLDYIIDGEQHVKYNVYIFEVEANIGKGVVRYFDCPVTHALCRKLYFDGYKFVSRKAIPGAMYRSQAKSGLERFIPDGSMGEEFIPYKPYGKTHYRGKLTPYGKRILRYQNIANRSEMLFFAWIQGTIKA